MFKGRAAFEQLLQLTLGLLSPGDASFSRCQPDTHAWERCRSSCSLALFFNLLMSSGIFKLKS